MLSSLPTTGVAIRFSENDVRAMGRNTRGVRGIRLSDDDFVVQMVVVNENEEDSAAPALEEHPSKDALQPPQAADDVGRGHFITCKARD